MHITLGTVNANGITSTTMQRALCLLNTQQHTTVTHTNNIHSAREYVCYVERVISNYNNYTNKIEGSLSLAAQRLTQSQWYCLPQQ